MASYTAVLGWTISADSNWSFSNYREFREIDGDTAASESVAVESDCSVNEPANWCQTQPRQAAPGWADLVIPGDATITGLKVRVVGSCGALTGTHILCFRFRNRSYSVHVAEGWKGTAKSHTFDAGDADSSFDVTLGSDTDLWGGTSLDFTAAYINAYVEFALRLFESATSGQHGKIGIDYIEVTVVAFAEVVLSSPIGGEEWRIGETREIAWSSTGVSTVTIALYDDGVFDSTIAAGVTALDEGYSWTIPSTVASGFNYKVRVTDDDSDEYDESDADFAIFAEGTPEIVVPDPEEPTYPDPPDDPPGPDEPTDPADPWPGDPEDPLDPWPPYRPPSLRPYIPEGASCVGLWVRITGTVYWESEPDSLDLIARFRDNEGYVGKALTAGKGTYWCPTCGWMWGRNPGATCPQCGGATESHPLWLTGEGSEQTFDYVFGGTDFAAASAGAGAYILPPNCCVMADAGFGVEFRVRSSARVDADNTVDVDSMTVVIFYEE